MRIRNKIVTMCYAIVLLLSIYHIALGQNDFEVDASQVGQAAAHPPEVGYTIIRGVDGQERGVFYENVNGVAMMEGDIRLGLVEELERPEETPDGAVDGVAIAVESARWPDGLLPYQFAPELPMATREIITEAMAHWEKHTPIRFIERTPSNQSSYPDYVLFVNEEMGCWAALGKRGGEQKINLFEQCTTGNTIHEIGHALGLFHEQSREDRDQFVRIVWENIEPGKEHNFERHVVDADDIAPYDYGSIMHYPQDAFSTNGLPTIEPLDPNAQIGQREELSQGDIETILTLYKEDTGVNDCSSFDGSFAGSLGHNDMALQPDNNHYFSSAGTHEGRLEGPSNADFDLYLYYWANGSWVEVAKSANTASNEVISYSGQEGYYIWAVHSYEGSGSYTFCLNTP